MPLTGRRDIAALRCLVVAASVALATVATASPQQAEPAVQPSQPSSGASAPRGGRVELGLQLGWRVGGLVRVPGVDLPLDIAGSRALGGRVGWRLSERFGVGVLLSHQETELIDQDIDELVAEITLQNQHVVGWLRPGRGAIRPELSASVGRTRLGLQSGGGYSTHPSAGFGIGVLAALSDRLMLTTHAHFVAALLGGNARILCGESPDPCLRTSNDTVLLQIQLTGGVSLVF